MTSLIERAGPPLESAMGGVFGGYTPSVMKEIAQELVSTAEGATRSMGSAYPFIENIGDGRGKAAQGHELDRVHWKPALAAAREDGLSPLGLYIYHDISVSHGPGSDRESFRGIIAGVKARGYRSPYMGGNELIYLTAIMAARDVVLRMWGAYRVDGRSSIGLKFLRERNVNLTMPLRWTIYGDTFSITTPSAA